MLAPVLLVALALSAVPAAPPDGPAAEPADEAADVVRLRFEWPAKLEAQAIERRTQIRSGRPTVVTAVRFTQTAVRRDGAIHIAAARMRWDRPRMAQAREAMAAVLRASEQIVQVVSPEGELLRVDGTAALGPALEQLFARPDVSAEQRARGIEAAELAMRAEAREAWNLAVGFWTGADLELGERYVMKTDAEVPLAPGMRFAFDQEFSVRRRVPCAAEERALRCVEITLRSTPDPALLPAVSRAVAPRLAAANAQPDAPLGELSIENELLLVTEPDTLLPHRVVWTRAVRATPRGDEGAPPTVEQVDRRETEFRYAPARAARKTARVAAGG
jgi:hypothetical protein